MTKGISPLIAAVVLIAFVIALTSVASTFFTGFTKEQKASVESKSSSMLDCGMAQMEINKNLVSSSVGKVLVGVENIGMTDLTGLKIVVYNETGAFELSTNPSTLDTSEIKMLHGTYSGDFIFDKISVTCTQCPGIEDSVSLTFSYQEDAEVYSHYPSGNPVNYLWMDGNWTTGEYPDLIGAEYFQINYTKLQGSKGAYWDIKDDESHFNVSVPSDCWNYDSNWLFFKLFGGEDEIVYYYCLNSTDYKLLRETSSGEYDRPYEEAIWWNVVDE